VDVVEEFFYYEIVNFTQREIYGVYAATLISIYVGYKMVNLFLSVISRYKRRRG